MPRGVKGSGPYGKVSGDTPPQNRPIIELEWEDPPPDVPTLVEPYLDVLMELQDKREVWGRIATFPTTRGAGGTAARLRKALADLDFGSYEFESRRVGYGSKLYARYMGAD